jgi:hypothetical protein
MSLIDQSLGPLARRADPDRHAIRGGKTWFSRDTIYRAQHYADLRWTRILVPAAAFAALFALGQFVLVGELAALAKLVAGIGLLVGLHGIASKALTRS